MTDTVRKPVDVVVVGVGVAGSIMCKELAQVGLKVVGLERGRMVDRHQDFAMPYIHDELKHQASRDDLVQDLSRETITFRNEIDQTALPMRQIGAFEPGECVGGAGQRWGGGALRFLPWDFETRSRTVERYGEDFIPGDCTSQDWGITYEEIEPYYDMFEEIYGIGGKAGNVEGEIQPGGNPFEGPRSREYPNPPSPRSYASTIFEEAATSLGYKPFPTPTATITEPFTNAYRQMLGQCVRGGFCTRHSCAMDAKGSPLSAVVPALHQHDNFELRPNCNVVKINLDPDKKRATGVTYVDARGRRVEQPAEIVVLTSYALNNTRLLLLSGIGTPYDPASGRGVVGRNYSYTSFGYASMFFNDRVFNAFFGSGGLGSIIDEFNADNFDHSDAGFMGGGFIGVQSRGAPPIGSHPTPPGTPKWGSEWKRAVKQYYNSTLGMLLNGGCQSYRMNYLDLDPTYRDVYGLPLLRMTFNWHDNEKKLSAFLCDRAREFADILKPAMTNIRPVTGNFSIVPYQSTHNVGGAAMGGDPETSVVNKYLQSWDVHNLFVVGGSAFPQNSANNPTPTIGMLACWASDAIVSSYRTKPGPLV